MNNRRIIVKSPEVDQQRVENARLKLVQTARFNGQKALVPAIAKGGQVLAHAFDQQTTAELDTYAAHSFTPPHLEVVAPEQPMVLTPQAAELARLRAEVAALHAELAQQGDDHGIAA